MFNPYRLLPSLTLLLTSVATATFTTVNNDPGPYQGPYPYPDRVSTRSAVSPLETTDEPTTNSLPDLSLLTSPSPGPTLHSLQARDASSTNDNILTHCSGPDMTGKCSVTVIPDDFLNSCITILAPNGVLSMLSSGTTRNPLYITAFRDPPNYSGLGGCTNPFALYIPSGGIMDLRKIAGNEHIDTKMASSGAGRFAIWAVGSLKLTAGTLVRTRETTTLEAVSAKVGKFTVGVSTSPAASPSTVYVTVASSGGTPIGTGTELPKSAAPSPRSTSTQVVYVTAGASRLVAGMDDKVVDKKVVVSSTKKKA